MKTPHKHAEIIKAWADGATVQCALPNTRDWVTTNTPTWVYDLQYRVKPEPKTYWFCVVQLRRGGRIHNTCLATKEETETKMAVYRTRGYHKLFGIHSVTIEE